MTQHTKKSVVAYLTRIAASAKDPACHYLGAALAEAELYKEIWLQWKDKFKKDEEIMTRIKVIEQVFESKLFNGALNKEFNTTIAIFGLKNNHDWKDKQDATTPTDTDVTWDEQKTYAEE